MKELKTEIVLNASPSSVYATLTDLGKYPEWNPFIVSSEGKAEVGERLVNTMLHQGREQVFRPVVTRAEKDKAFEWLGSGLLGMFKGRHYFILEDLGNGQTKLSHGEKFSGLLSGPVLRWIGEDTLKSFQAMNQALKKRVEKTAG